MSTKFKYLIVTTVIAVTIILASVQLTPTRVLADGGTSTPDTDFPIIVNVTGTIQSLTDTGLVLADGTVIQIEPSTFTPIPLAVGEMVSITAQLQDNTLLARVIVAGTTPATLPAVLPTAQPVAALPTVPPLLPLPTVEPTEIALCQ